jgi:hypothetical protein
MDIASASDASIDCRLNSAPRSSLNEFCPRKEAWALIGGTPYPLAKLRKFRFVAESLLNQCGMPLTAPWPRNVRTDAVRAFALQSPNRHRQIDALTTDNIEQGQKRDRFRAIRELLATVDMAVSAATIARYLPRSPIPEQHHKNVSDSNRGRGRVQNANRRRTCSCSGDYRVLDKLSINNVDRGQWNHHRLVRARGTNLSQTLTISRRRTSQCAKQSNLVIGGPRRGRKQLPPSAYLRSSHPSSRHR